MAKDILKDEILSENDLDNVTGGSNAEYGSLFVAIGKNPAINGGKMLNYNDVDAIKNLLHDKLGIDAEINVNLGFVLGPNDPSIKANKYTDVNTGKPLRNSEVLKRIADYS